jgi:hypothetical protein
MSAHVPRLKARVLTVFLLVGLPMLAVGVGLVLAIGRTQLSDRFGQHLQDVAQQTAAGVDAYLSRRLVDVALLGREPELRRMAQAGSSVPFDRAKAAAADDAWLKAVVDNPASRFLADIVSHDAMAGYREVVLTDRFGRVVAASSPPSSSFYGDADWWKAVTAEGGRARVTMTDVRWDERARTHAIAFSVPVPATDSEALAGVLTVVADSRELLAMVGSVQLGATGEAVLLRDNGSIVYSRRAADPNARFFALETFKQQAERLRLGGPDALAHYRAPAPPDDSPWLVGLAASQLGRTYPNASWIVAVSQSEAEVLAPVDKLGWYLVGVFALVAFVILAAALYISMKQAAPAVDVDMHLVRHPGVAHVGEVEPEEEVEAEPAPVRR